MTEEFFDVDVESTLVKRGRFEGDERRENSELVEMGGLRDEVRSMREESRVGRDEVKQILTGIATMSGTLQQILSRMERQEERADALERRVQEQSEKMKEMSEEVRGLREEKCEWKTKYD